MGDCPEDVIVPVILLPGIMGSRLKNSLNQTVWDPDSKSLMLGLYGTFSGGVVGPDLFRIRESHNVRLAASVRKAVLIGDKFDKTYLSPIENKTVKDGPISIEGYDDDINDRNWSSVSLDTYGQIMRQIESAFPGELNRLVKRANPKFNLVKMPVYACGYNWSQSNHDSGKTVAKRIKEWVKKARDWADANNAQCPGAIVVTHSMGGFVARSAALSHGAAGDILTVISTVMPTDGAPATYKRFHFGFENPAWDAIGKAGYVVMGRQGEIVTAILGHMPGAQELLPNKQYRDNSGETRWLTIRNPDRNLIGNLISGPQSYAALPKSNPYTEIYRREDRMWRAANPEWLFPEGLSSGGNFLKPFTEFAKHNKTAEAWHDHIIKAGNFHELTYMCHSGDPSLKTYDHISWRPDKVLGSYGRSIDEDDVTLESGETPDYHRETVFWGDESDKHVEGPYLAPDWKIDPAAGAGDTTVPVSASSYFVSSDRRTVHNPGYEHEPAIKDATVINWVREKMIHVLGNCELY